MLLRDYFDSFNLFKNGELYPQTKLVEVAFKLRKRKAKRWIWFPGSIERHFEKSCDKIAEPDWFSNERRKSRERAHLANAGAFRASSYETGRRKEFVFCSYGKFNPGNRDEKCPKGPQNTRGTAFRLVSDITSHAQLEMFRPDSPGIRLECSYGKNFPLGSVARSR